ELKIRLSVPLSITPATTMSAIEEAASIPVGYPSDFLRFEAAAQRVNNAMLTNPSLSKPR
ncbi:MAG: hypothetical protein QHJ82_17075, partial [Verrucomicrobiota bacterium]|nr:hypothetical protein [Verrucomicrobiota bacterium]